jgi:hypothetical protein
MSKSVTISKLTPEQEAQIPVFVDKWIKKASEKMDRDKAIQAVKENYTLMGQEKPIVIFGRSPFETTILCSKFLRFLKNKPENLFSQLGSQLCSQLGSQLCRQLHSQLGSQLHSQLGRQLCRQLHSQLGRQLHSQLGRQLHSQLGSSWLLNNYWMSWAGFYDFANFIGVNFDDKIYNLFLSFVSEVIFIIPYKGIAFVSEKPSVIHWSDDLLHNDAGAAVRYEDGYSLYSFNGVGVTEKIIMTPEKITVEEIEAEKNLEVQRIMIERFGVDKYLIETGAELIDSDMRGIEGGGARCLVQDKKNNKWLIATDGSTERVYHMLVAENVKTCREAHESLSGFSETLIKMEG